MGTRFVGILVTLILTVLFFLLFLDSVEENFVIRRKEKVSSKGDLVVDKGKVYFYSGNKLEDGKVRKIDECDVNSFMGGSPNGGEFYFPKGKF